MQPRDPNNFLIEVTPEVMDELNKLYVNSDEQFVAELHYSPYWNWEEHLKRKRTESNPRKEIEG